MKKFFTLALLVAFVTGVKAQVTSTFDTDAEGWTFYHGPTGTYSTVNYSASGGNPNGTVSVTYASQINTSAIQYWIAPAKFLGTKVAQCLDMNLKFDLQQSVAGTNASGRGDVRIKSGNSTILLSLPTKPAVAPLWSSYTIPLNETGGWQWSNLGTAATRDQIKSILSNITAIEINGTYAANASYLSGLDNVVLEERSLSPAPIVSSLSIASGKPGQSITINGSGFNTTPSNNIVRFGAVAATITNATATQLTVTIPIGAQYGKIEITNKVTGLTGTSLQPFNPLFDGGGRIIRDSFKPRVDITPTTNVQGFTVEDIDGDGWSDLIMSSSTTSKTISIYPNLGLGGEITAASFAPVTTVTIPGASTNYTGVQFADLDGDGKLDLITSNVLVNFGGAYFITYRNISTPGNIAFEAPETWAGLTDDTPPSLITDLDGDGRPELIGGEGSYSTGAYFWIAQNISSPGNIEFGGSVGYFINASNGGFGGASVGDLDGDGKNELMVAHGDRYSIFKNNSTPGSLSLTSLGMITSGQYITSLQAVDFNLDGKNDLIWKNNGVTLYVRLNTNSGAPLALTDFTTEVTFAGDLNSYGGFSIADINGDGKPDIAASEDGDVGVYENTFSGGTFDGSSIVPAYQLQGYAGGTYPTSPIVADLNGDNKSDLIVATTNIAIRISIFENKNVHAPVISVNTVFPLKGAVGSTVTITGNNFSTTTTDNHVWFGGVEATVLTASANLLTVEVPPGATYAPVSVTRNGLTSRYHLPFQLTFGQGVDFNNTHFAPPVTFTLTGATYYLDIGDLNHDSKPDIIAQGGANTYAFLNAHTTGVISSTSLIPDDTLAGSSYPRLQDLDGDGYFDVMAVNGPLRKNNSTSTEISFMPTVNVPLGASIVDFADFNNDGKTDMTLTTDLSGTGDLIVLENRSISTTGNFASGTYGSFSGNFLYNKPAANGGTITGDFDGDGFTDIVTTNPGSDNISIYRNLGLLKISNAQFATRVDMAVGDDPYFIYKGDFDADGKLDLMVCHWTGTSTTLIIVLQNTSTVGNISFSRIDLTNPSVVTTAHIGDLDGDGKPEILTTSEAGNRFSIFKNIHTSGALTAASFAAPFNTTVTAPRGIATADLNLDGKPEIIVTRTAGLLVVYENLISPIPPPTLSSFTPTSGPIGTTVNISGTNFDTTPANNVVFFGATRATVTAATATQLTVTVPEGATYQPMNVSVNGFTVHASQPFVVTFAGGGTIDNCSFTPAASIATVGATNRSVLCDVDGDGKTDLVVPDRTNDRFSVFRNTGTSGTPSFASAVNFLAVDDPVGSAYGDVDGDGKPDVAIVNYTSGQISVFKNLSTPGTISFAVKVDFTIPSFSHDVSIVDVDGDGKLDLAVTTSLNGFIVFRNTGTTGVINTSTFAAGVTFTTGPNSFPSVLGDIDGDGKVDAAVPNANAYTISVLRNTSTPGALSFAAATTLTITTGTPALGQGTGYTALGDIDGDNKLDLVATTNTVFKVSFFRNTSTPGALSFDARFDITSTAAMTGPAISDLDGDGKIDLVIDRGLTGLSIYKNTATSGVIDAASFATPIDKPRASSGINLIGDIDGDGRNDILSTHTNIQIFRNLIGTISPPTITSFTPTVGLAGAAVTITGTNLTTPFSTEVRFNGTLAAISNNTGISIQTQVPVGATTGPIQINVGCNSVTSNTNFTVAPPASITINPQPVSAGVCEGGVATFTLMASGTSNISYQWQKFDGAQFNDISNTSGYTGATTSTLTINTTGNFGEGDYRCSVSGDNATTVFSSTASLSFTTSTTIAEITINGTTLTASPGDSYQWYYNGDVVSGATSQSFEFNALEYGVYAVDVTENGCTTTSDDFIYLITGIEKNTEGLKVYPNPWVKNLTLEYQAPYELYIIDVTGKVVYQAEIKTGSTSIDLSSLANGLYLLRLKNELGQRHLRISKK